MANDLSPDAVVAIRRNVEYNNAGYPPSQNQSVHETSGCQKVLIEQGDAW